MCLSCFSTRLQPELKQSLLLLICCSLLLTCALQVLALCLNRGPLTVTKTFPQFLAALLLPIIPRPGQRGGGKGGGTSIYLATAACIVKRVWPCASMHGASGPRQLSRASVAVAVIPSRPMRPRCDTAATAAPAHTHTCTCTPAAESVSTSHSSRREGRLQDASASSSVLLLRWLAKGAVLGVVVYALVGTPDMPMVAKHALYALGMYAFIGERRP